MQNRLGVICKLGDFGMARTVDRHQSHVNTLNCGTISHMPPEVLRHNRLTQAADVYSFAMLSKCRHCLLYVYCCTHKGASQCLAEGAGGGCDCHRQQS